MDKKLETYLQTVERELGDLETEQRENELREMRQHIEAIVARLVEGGLSENEAIEAAIAQFGNAPQNGRALREVSHKRDTRKKRAAAVGAALSCWAVPLLLSAPLANSESQWSQHVIISLCFVAALASGAVAAIVAPRVGKQAVLGLFGFLFALEAVTSLVKSIQMWRPDRGIDFYHWILPNWNDHLMTLFMVFLTWLGATIATRYAQRHHLESA